MPRPVAVETGEHEELRDLVDGVLYLMTA